VGVQFFTCVSAAFAIAKACKVSAIVCATAAAAATAIAAADADAAAAVATAAVAAFEAIYINKHEYVLSMSLSLP